MDSFEMNKVLGAVLGCCLGVVALNIASGAVFAPHMPAKPGYEIAVPEKHPAGEGQKGPAQPEVPLEQLLAKADISKGQGSAQKCQSCHTFEKGGRNMIGPNLWGIVGRPKASHEGFNYSPALKAVGGNWTLEDINHFITKPQAMVPGTAMSFPGVPRPTERADILAYLNSLSDNPAPLTKGAELPSGTQRAELTNR